MGHSHKNLVFRNHWTNCNQTLVEWSLDGPLRKLCPMILTSNQDGRQAKNRKKGDEVLKKIFSETYELISTKLCWNDPWMVPFQRCVRWSRLSSKMVAKLKIVKWWDAIKKKMFSSETTEAISTKLCWNDPCVVPFQNCIRPFRPPTEMTATAELNLT